MTGTLTAKQRIFINEYLKDMNATRAYMVAYPHIKSEKSGASAASRMLRNVKVKSEIEKRMRARERRLEVKQDDVLRELIAMAFSDITDYTNIVTHTEKDPVTGKRKREQSLEITDTADLTKMQKKAISCIKNGKYGIEVRLEDKLKAIELLGRYMGMWKDKVEISDLTEQKNTLDDILRQMRGDDE